MRAESKMTYQPHAREAAAFDISHSGVFTWRIPPESTEIWKKYGPTTKTNFDKSTMLMQAQEFRGVTAFVSDPQTGGIRISFPTTASLMLGIQHVQTVSDDVRCSSITYVIKHVSKLWTDLSESCLRAGDHSVCSLHISIISAVPRVPWHRVTRETSDANKIVNQKH